MCKLIADLAGADKQVIKEVLARLEGHSASPGVDIRLTGEIYGKLHMKVRALGLDPADTTPHELYLALLNLADLHDGFLAKRLGIKQRRDADEVARAVSIFATRMRLPKQSWALKHTAIKRLLKAMPPKNLMKLLHYRSVESMLKREPPALLLAVARHTEGEPWQQRFVQSYKTTKSNEFETRDIEIEYLAEKRWKTVGELFTSTRRSNIMHAPEAGAIVLLPLPAKNLKGLTITNLLLVLHYINEIRAFSTYCKFHHMRPNFGVLLYEHLKGDKHNHVSIASHPVHWRVVHRYYGTVARKSHPEIFEPHVQPEDLSYRKAEEVLYSLEPALHFWHDMDYVGLPQPDGPLSFNLTDAAMNLVNDLPYERRAYYHLQGAIWNEMYFRYVGQRSFEQNVLQQLDLQAEFSVASALDTEFVW